MLRNLATRFTIGFLLATVVVMGTATLAQSGVANCHPAWKCVPTPTRTPAPTVAPTAPPTPAPTVLPTPLPQRVDPPVTTGTVTVPGSIDPTGATDVSSAMNAFIASVPNGRVIQFPTGATYRLSTAIRLTGRSDLRFEGNGDTLIASDTASAGPRNSHFLIESGSTRIYIGSFHGVGASPAADVGTVNALDLVKQNSEFVAAYDAHNLEIANVTVERVWGDGIYLGADAGGGGSNPTTRVWWHDSSVLSAGRNGVAIEHADQVWVERVSFTNIALHVLDIEPFMSGHGGTNVEFIDNPIGTYGHTNHFTPYFFAADGAPNSVTTDVNVQRNTVVGNNAGINGSALGLNTTVVGPTRSNIFVRDNTAQKTLAGPVMHFTSVAGVTVTHNVQPLGTGVLSEFISCSGVTSGPNP